MCGLFPCIPIFEGFIFYKRYNGMRGLIFCVKRILWVAAIHTTFKYTFGDFLISKVCDTEK